MIVFIGLIGFLLAYSCCLGAMLGILFVAALMTGTRRGTPRSGAYSPTMGYDGRDCERN